MKDEKHLLSDSAEWMTTSEFVDSEGKIFRAIGETKITANCETVTNESWACIDGRKVYNTYTIAKESELKYRFESENPDLGTQTGEFNIDRNVVYSKFTVKDTDFSGFEVIIKDEDECNVYGTLFNGSKLVNTWRTIMVRLQ
jgi:hypothetical protein